MDSPYTQAYYEDLEAGSHRSAREVVPLVLGLIHARSVVDVGCGSGAWLSAFVDHGIEDYLGIDGDYVDKGSLEIPAGSFRPFDLRKPLLMDREFDLVVSVEVAEHLSEEYADIFIDSLTKLGPLVLFSAAIPGQGGTEHVNEQWPGYWADHFERRGYLAIDCLRPRIWHNDKVEYWYAQNLLLFVRKNQIRQYPLLKGELRKTNYAHLAMIHPRLRQWLPAEPPPNAPVPVSGKTHAVRVEITDPIPDVATDAPCERLHCTVLAEGTCLGTLELPVCDGLVSCHVLADAIAAGFAWPVLGRFLEHTIYPGLTVKNESGGLSLWRGDVCLVESVTENENEFFSRLHDRAGWTIFLQELWGRPDWPQSRFYNPQDRHRAATRHHVTGRWHQVEISGPFPDLVVRRQKNDIVLTMGGTALGELSVSANKNVIKACQLRAAFLMAGGFETCRVAVREGLLGRSFSDPLNLRERLSAAAARQTAPWPAIAEPAGGLNDLSFPDGPVVVFGRRDSALFDTSASRRASLPAAATSDLVEMAAVAGEPVVHRPDPGQSPKRAVYTPDMIRRPVAAAPGRIAGIGRWLGKLVPGNRFPQLAGKSRLSGASPSSSHLVAVSGNCQGDDLDTTDRLPILMYHRVSADESMANNSLCVPPADFEVQLQYLRDAGYHGIQLKDWQMAITTRTPLPGKAVLITFDGGYADFLQHAWPLLQAYGLSATVFLCIEMMNRTAIWDSIAYGPVAPALNLSQLRQLGDAGVEFGSYSTSQLPLSSLGPAEIVRAGTRSRTILGRELGVPIKAFAYPQGGVDGVVEHLIGACGYTFGLTWKDRQSNLNDRLLALPRLAVARSVGIEEFASRLHFQCAI